MGLPEKLKAVAGVAGAPNVKAGLSAGGTGVDPNSGKLKAFVLGAGFGSGNVNPPVVAGSGNGSGNLKAGNGSGKGMKSDPKSPAACYSFSY